MLQIKTEQTDGQVIIHLQGRMDLGGAKTANQSFMEQAELTERIILDCAELEYVASAGLRVLRQLHQTLKDKGGTLTLKSVCPEVMDIFEMTGFDALLTIEH